MLNNEPFTRPSSPVPRPITVLVAAVGGQGGQLFSQWLFSAAREAGFYPVGVGLPGLSQREGATTYYLEFFRRPQETALFSPFPEKGRVQVLIGLELLELLRAVQENYLAPDGVIVGSTHRVLTAEEKLPLKGGFITAEQAVPFLHQLAPKCFVVDAVSAAALAGLSERAANAILFGILAAVGVLPFPVDAFRRAIETYGVAVSFNLRAFEFGLQFQEWQHRLRAVDDPAVREWEELPEPRLSPATQQQMRALSQDDELARTLAWAARWLCHYQDERYFLRYLDSVRTIWEIDRTKGMGLLVTKEVARILALRMAYEDAVRVAQLKTARHRFARLRREHQLNDKTVYRVVDFLSPDWDELLGLLPLPAPKERGRGTRNEGRRSGETEKRGTEKAETVASPFAGDGCPDATVGDEPRRYHEIPPLPEQADELSRSAVQLRLTTTSLTGYLLLKSLTLLKPLRPYSRRFRLEWVAISEWLTTVREALANDYDLAFLLARSGELVRGYGRTRRKTLAAWRAFIAFLRELQRREIPSRQLVEFGEEFLTKAFSGPKGPEQAWQFAVEQLSRLDEK